MTNYSTDYAQPRIENVNHVYVMGKKRTTCHVYRYSYTQDAYVHEEIRSFHGHIGQRAIKTRL